MTAPANLTQRPPSPPPEPGTPTRFDEPTMPDVTPEQVHAVLRDIIRRDPALWSRVQQDRALWQAFGFDTEAGDSESRTASVSAG
jgi:hypothetical protein